MDSTQDYQSPPVSRLLQLPREIRDLIYGHVLIKDVISIECALTQPITPTRSLGSRDLLEPKEGLYFLRASKEYRRMWSIPSFDIVTQSSFDHDRNTPSAMYMTYQIADSLGIEMSNRVDVSLLQVCRQIYTEASKTFYGGNVFSFTSDFRIPTAFAFLCDRPAASLHNIKSLEISLMEANNLRGTAQAPYPIVRRSTDSLVLQYAYQYFTELCTLLSTSRMNLRRLCLTVETMAIQGDGGRLGLRDGLAQEKQEMNCPRPWIPLWLDPLLKIEGLDLLEVRWVSNRPQIQRMVDTIDLLQRHMFTGTPSKYTSHVLTESFTDREGRKLKFQRQHDACPDIDLPLEDDENCRELLLGNNGLRHEEVASRDEAEVFRRFTDRPHCREILESYSDAYASYYRLKCA